MSTLNTFAFPYCTPTLFLERYDVRTVGDFLSDTDIRLNPAQVLNSTILLDFLRSSSATLEAFALKGTRYSVADLQLLANLDNGGNPKGNVGNAAHLIYKIVVGLTMNDVWTRRPLKYAKHGRPEGVEEAYMWCQSLGEGATIFGLLETAQVGVPQPEFMTPAQIRTRNFSSVQARAYFGSRAQFHVPGYPGVGSSASQGTITPQPPPVPPGPPAPTITGINMPISFINGGVPLVLTGTGFSNVASVKFGSAPAQYAFVKSDTELHTSMFPVSAAQTVNLTLTQSNNLSASIPFTFISKPVNGTQNKIVLTTADTGARLSCLGNDLNIWWASAYGAAYKMTPAGVVTVYPLNTSLPDYLFDVCAGPGGFLWYTGQTTGSIYKVSVDGSVPPVATLLPGSGIGNGIYSVLNICTGPDARLWVNSPGTADTLMYAVTDGNVVTPFLVPGYLLGCPIANPNGNLWLPAIKVADGLQYLVELNTNGQIVGTPQLIAGVVGTITSIRIGVDGNIWGLDNTSVVGTNAFLKIPPGNPAATARYVANLMHQMTAITVDGQGNLWASDGVDALNVDSFLAKCTIMGTVTQFTATGSGVGFLNDVQSVCTDVNGIPNFPYYIAASSTTPAAVYQMS